jgi:4'-phosphopantetheinyl transferase
MTVLDLRIAHVAECLAPSLTTAYARLLSPDEAARHARFRFQRDQDRYLVSRALLRTALAQKVAQAPGELVFKTSPYGKPSLLQACDSGARLCFSLSHAEDTILLAIATDCELGVDIENTDRPAPLEVVRSQFADVEVQAVLAPDRSASSDELFWALWTLKESLIKATGEGLHAPLNRFGFVLNAHHQGIGLHAAPDTPEGARSWWLGQWAPTPRHLAAVCMAWPNTAPQARGDSPTVRATKVTPLVGESDLQIELLRSSSAS